MLMAAPTPHHLPTRRAAAVAVSVAVLDRVAHRVAHQEAPLAALDRRAHLWWVIGILWRLW